MENASKALIIVGAILLSILIIGMGMSIFTETGGQTDDAVASMDAQAIQTFNNQFTMYAGESVSGTKVDALLGFIIANNEANADIEAKVIKVTTTVAIGSGNVNFANANDSSNISKLKTAINKRANYKVEIEYENGLVHIVKITQN